MTSVGIHQPNFMPWLGYFRKISQSDKFIFLDSVKCSKNSYLNRNKFSTSKKFNDYFWLSCPLKKESYRKEISEVNVDSKFITKHLKHLKMRHSKTEEVDYLSHIIKTYQYFQKSDNFKIADLNVAIIKLTCEYLDIKTNFFLSSSTVHDYAKTKQLLVIDLIKSVDGNEYISGQGAKSYQDDDLFLKEGIKVVYYENRQNNLIKIKNESISMIDLILHFGIEECKKMILV